MGDQAGVCEWKEGEKGCSREANCFKYGRYCRSHHKKADVEYRREHGIDLCVEPECKEPRTTRRYGDFCENHHREARLKAAEEQCEGPKCSKAVEHRKYGNHCQGHYLQAKRGVDPLEPLEERRPAGSVQCEEKGCRKAASNFVYGSHCAWHGRKALLEDREIRGEFCSFPRCFKPWLTSKYGRLCNGHYQQRAAGKPLTELGSSRPKPIEKDGEDGVLRMCRTCEEFKPLSEFQTRTMTLKSGELKVYVLQHCSSCGWLRLKKWAKDNPELIRAAARDNRRRVKVEYAKMRQAGEVDLSPKPCTRCGVTKDLSEFPTYWYSKDGVGTVCSDCEREVTRDYQARPEVAEQRRLRARERYATDASKVRINWTRYYEKKKKEDPEFWATKTRAYLEKNRERVSSNQHKRRARKMDAGVFLITDKELSRIYSSRCAYCGGTERIEADHIIPIAKGGRHSIGNLQPLCRTHNQSKKDKIMVEWLFFMAIREASEDVEDADV